MLTATVLAIFFVPVFFVLVQRSLGRRKDDKLTPEAAPSEVG